MMQPVQCHAIFTGTKKTGLARGQLYAVFIFDSMTASCQLHVRRAGSLFAKVCQQRCAAMRPVVVSVWYNKTGTGFQN